MTRPGAATRPYNHDVAIKVIALLHKGYDLGSACTLADADRASFFYWKRVNEPLAKMYTLATARKRSAPLKGISTAPERKAERLRLMALESAPPPAGKDHYFVLGLKGQECAFCKQRPKTALPGRCVPAGGVFHAGWNKSAVGPG